MQEELKFKETFLEKRTGRLCSYQWGRWAEIGIILAEAKINFSINLYVKKKESVRIHIYRIKKQNC